MRCMSNTPQGGAIEGSAADDVLMVDQGMGPKLLSSPGFVMLCHQFVPRIKEPYRVPMKTSD